jgi:hypothetical protein
LKIDGVVVECNLVKADQDSLGWHVLMQFQDDKKVAKISLEKFGECIPNNLQRLKDSFKDWINDAATDKTEFSDARRFDYIDNVKSEKLTGLKPGIEGFETKEHRQTDVCARKAEERSKRRLCLEPYA